MAHSSLPIYLDPPNWQQSNQPSTNDQDPRHLPSFLPPPPSQTIHAGGVAGSIRPGSMAYRARLAMIPQPEAALKCPRCDSTNTKFCYFNNYSLTQPRHFCKTCRRYWTRGGALRNVPVGGGFRKNKKKKKTNRSKSPAAAAAVTEMGSGNPRSSGGAMISTCCNIESSTIGHFPSQPPQLPSLPSLQHLSLFGAGNTGLNFNGIQLGNLNSGRDHLDQWRQQPPFIVAGLESPAGAAYPLIQTDHFASNSSALQYCHQLQNLTPFSRISQQHQLSHQLKNEDENQTQQGISNFLRPPMGSIAENNHSHSHNHSHFWAGDHQNSWTDISALSSSSSSHLL